MRRRTALQGDAHLAQYGGSLGRRSSRGYGCGADSRSSSVTAADDDDALKHSAATGDAQGIVQARQQAEQALLQTRTDLDTRTEELARSLAMMRATLESTTDGILAVDGLGRIITFNSRLAEMLPGTPARTEGGDHIELAEQVSTYFKDASAYVTRLRDIYSSRQPESYDVLELADGRVFERFSRIQYVNGYGQGRVWSFRDITERRRAEMALREEKRMLELLNETGVKLASKLDVREVLQAVTDAATTISGASFGAFFYNSVNGQGEQHVLYVLSGLPHAAGATLGQPRATPLLGPTFAGAAPVRCDDVLTDPRYAGAAPFTGMPDQHPPVRSYLAVPVVSRSSEVLGGLFLGHTEPGVFTERTEKSVVAIASQATVAVDNARLYEAAQRAAEERQVLLASERTMRSEAERMSALKDEFLTTLSHELRTPLGAILGWAQILRHGRRGRTDIDKGLETIERNARVQAQLIEDLLDMGRISSGKVRLDAVPVELAGVVQAAIDTVRPAAQAKGIRVEAMLDAHAGPVSGDPNRLQQIVWNLLSNAIKFTNRQGKVLVALARVNSHVEISVADTGNGIRPEFLAHVFERFRQADGSTTRSYGGLGLGLSIVKNLVELHGGTVEAQSPGIGLGATFTVRLPCMAVQMETFGRADGLGGPQRIGLRHFRPIELGGLAVMVVDDDADARAMVRRVLEDCNSRVLSAASPEEALALLQNERPDVLVSDIGMPGVDGYDFMRQVRKLGAAGGGDIPAVALTAFARPEDRVKALDAGYQAYLCKPVDPSELAAAVASVAGRTPAGDALPPAPADGLGGRQRTEGS
jgi:PAS domain S-box-containing protein